MNRITGGILLACAVAVIASALTIFAEMGTPEGLVKLRNSMLFDIGAPTVFEWGPSDVPGDFKLEAERGSPFFQDVVRGLPLRWKDPDASIENALAIARHLADKKSKSPVPIKSDTKTAYHGIVLDGQGYCADYTQVFMALALSAGISVREWGMSFAGYSGDGHAFNEVYDPSRGKWVLIDPFFSFFVTDENGTPLSALEFFDVLDESQDRLVSIIPINESVFSFKPPLKAIDYYRRGRDSIFMTWGNNVLTYDRTPVVQRAARLSRAVEQMTAIISGVHPSLMIAEGMENREALKELRRLRIAILVLLASGTLFLVVGGYWLLARRKQRALEIRSVE